MVARITNRLRNYNLNQFSESFSESNTNFYFFIAKDTSWSNESIPDTPQDTPEARNLTYREIIAMKKLLSGDKKPIVTRYNWEFNTIYTQWSSSDELIFTKNFYVMNSFFGVYKCLSNNKGVPSTVEPTGTGVSNITTGDGYVWKYLYTLTTPDVAKFVSGNWIPVYFDSTVRAGAIDGALETINVINGGSGYTTATVSITSFSGSGAAATAIISGGQITGIAVTNKGINYRDAVITITGDGTGATAQAPIGPVYGHGYDPEKELGCTHLMLVAEVIGSEFPTSIDYRKIGVVVNPYENDGVTLATDAIYTDMTDIKLYTGDILYMEHRVPYNRTEDSTEKYMFAIRF